MDDEVDVLLSEVEHARRAVLDSVEGLDERQAAFKQTGDDWSCCEVLEHLYLAELSGIAKIWAALDAVRSGKGWTGESPHKGKRIEQIIRETWKEREQAPPIAVPHIGGPVRFWQSAFRSLVPLLADLGTALRGQPLERIVFPHFISGPLDARQRLEFLRYHMQRHLEQLERIKNSSEFPATMESKT